MSEIVTYSPTLEIDLFPNSIDCSDFMLAVSAVLRDLNFTVPEDEQSLEEDDIFQIILSVPQGINDSDAANAALDVVNLLSSKLLEREVKGSFGVTAELVIARD